MYWKDVLISNIRVFLCDEKPHIETGIAQYPEQYLHPLGRNGRFSFDGTYGF